MFAVAAFDAQHKLISELGQPAGPVAALLPLPLYQCWCQLALTAAQLGASRLCHVAAAVVTPHFITTRPDCPAWEANPLDAQQLNRCVSSVNDHACMHFQACIHEYPAYPEPQTSQEPSPHQPFTQPAQLRLTRLRPVLRVDNGSVSKQGSL